MSTFILTVQANAAYAGGNPPAMEVLVNGVVASSQNVLASSTLTFYLEFTGNFPASISLRFNAGSGDPGDTITINSVRINGQSIDTSTDLTSTLLTQGQVAAMTTAANDHLFGRVEPSSGDLGTPTQSGSGSDDTLNGGAGADVIDGSGGADRIRGMGDDDAINGGAGDDFIFGEGGNDIILGGDGNDIILGGDGDDIIYGQANDDYLIGDAGNDILNGGAGNDGLLGGDGNDILFGEDGDDWLLGDAGDDRLYGDDGNDTLLGGDGNDIMFGGNGNDAMYGEVGDDIMFGEAGNDTIDGGDGADTIDGGSGNDTIDGGAGNDIISGGADDDYIFGSAGDDTLNGDGGADMISGGAGADTINGGTGNDILHGHGLSGAAIGAILSANPNVVYNAATNSFYQYVSGAVTWAAARTAAEAATLGGVAGHMVSITSAAENSFVYAMTGGAETWIGASDAATEGAWTWAGGPEGDSQFSNIAASVNNFYVNWQSGDPNGNNTINVAIMNASGQWFDRAGSETHGYVIEWDAGGMSDDNAADIINGGAGNDWIYGYGGNDTLNGDADNDIIFGGAGDDIMDGGSGNDYLVGGTGSDTINGGANDDVLHAAVAGALLGSQNVTGASGGGSITYAFINETFTGSAGVFTYVDYNDPGNVDVTGVYTGADGDAGAGAVQVTIDSTGGGFTDAVGLYQTTFVSGSVGTNTQITFSYRHTHTDQNDNGEDSSVFLILNGVLYDQFGGNGFINTALGSGGATDTGWVTVTVDLPNLVAGATNTVWLGLHHSDSNQSNEDAWVRFDDVLLTSDISSITLVNENFTSNTGVFAYTDGGFGGTDPAQADADESRVTTDGGAANGALQVFLDGSNGNASVNISGNWNTTINSAYNLTNVQVTFAYRHWMSVNMDAGDDSQVWLEFDGTAYNQFGANSYINQHTGANGDSGNDDTGWVTVTVDLPDITAGANYLLSMGIFLTAENNSNEDAFVRLDDIVVTGDIVTSTGNTAPSSGNDSTAINVLNGGDGNDTLYGSAGQDTLLGGNGTDSLYSDSSQVYTVADALAEKAGLVYNASTNSFYLYVSGAVTAPTAFAAAAANTLHGVAGHIVHITSAIENTYIDTLTGTSTVWLGAQDTAVEGEWRWIGGVLDQELFWLGNASGSAQNGYYENFNGGEPNDWTGGEDYMELQNGGGWNDNGGPQQPGLTRGYVIEWEASEVFSFGATTLNGGAGADNLYGSGGADLFIFDDNTDAFTNPDTIFNFDMNDGDAIDISDILDGLGVTAANISNYVDVSSANGVRVDTTGSGSFGAGTAVATFSGATAVSDETTMLNAGNLIIY